MIYAYLRVSAKDQNLDRQIIGVKDYCPDLLDENIFADKKSGKDFNRKEYIRLKSLLRPGDELIIKELDRLGRNKEGIKEELKWFKDNGITVRILNIPTTLIDFQGQEWIRDMINNILVEVLSSIAEEEREGKFRSAMLKARMTIKAKHEDRVDARDKKRLERYIDEEINYILDCYDAASFLIADAELSIYEVAAALKEYEERFGNEPEEK